MENDTQDQREPSRSVEITEAMRELSRQAQIALSGMAQQMAKVSAQMTKVRK